MTCLSGLHTPTPLRSWGPRLYCLRARFFLSSRGLSHITFDGLQIIFVVGVTAQEWASSGLTSSQLKQALLAYTACCLSAFLARCSILTRRNWLINCSIVFIGYQIKPESGSKHVDFVPAWVFTASPLIFRLERSMWVVSLKFFAPPRWAYPAKTLILPVICTRMARE